MAPAILAPARGQHETDVLRDAASVLASWFAWQRGAGPHGLAPIQFEGQWQEDETNYHTSDVEACADSETLFSGDGEARRAHAVAADGAAAAPLHCRPPHRGAGAVLARRCRQPRQPWPRPLAGHAHPAAGAPSSLCIYLALSPQLYRQRETGSGPCT